MKIKQHLLAALFFASTVASFGSHAQGIEWPNPSAAVVQGGVFAATDRLRTLGPGMTKEQLIANIGTQHFLDNPSKPNVWNYIFSFRTKPNPNEFITCQFQVLFKGDVSVGYAWRPSSCATAIQSHQAAAREQGIGQLAARPQECARCKPPAPVVAAAEPPAPPPAPVAPPPAPPAEPAPPPPPPAPRNIELSGDALFKFRGGDFQHLLPGGKEELDRVAKELKGVSLDRIEIYGFTDTLGKDSINMPLSQKRADTVKAYLMANGVSAGTVVSQGRGAQEPVKVCEGSREVRIACEAPNRRVLIKAFGKQ